MKKRLVEQRLRAEKRGNITGGNDWELYRHHRERQTQAVLATAPAQGKAIFLGAGNCNDLDLELLAERLAEIHLVDIDASALRRAADRQTAAVRQRLHLHGGIDLTGLLVRLGSRSHPMTTFAHFENALAPATEDIVKRLPHGMDLSVSCCVATQLYFGITRALPPDDAMLVSARQAGLVIHLRTMAAVVKAGAPMVLANDLVSSETYPVETLPDDDLVTAVGRLADATRVFEAANPIILRRILRRDPVLRAQVGDTQITAAWLWTGPLARTYLVYAMQMVRNADV